jgi:DNA-binding NarL/FixJ family response regulator
VEPGHDRDTPARVLICDDNAMIRSLLSDIVSTSAALRVVGEAGDGNTVIAEATRLQPDVIVLDLAMPHLSGLEALPELRRVAPHAQIVVFSGFASKSVAEQVLALGATSYLEKGAHPDTIVATIEHALSRNGTGPLTGTSISGARIQARDS